MHTYRIHKATVRPELLGLWRGHAWDPVPAVDVSAFRPESSDHRPETRVKLLYDDQHLFGIFHVQDRYVHCTNTRYQSPVCKDSCVECFFQPFPGSDQHDHAGYFNFEINCGGTLYVSYITDSTIGPDRKFKEVTMLPPGDGNQVRIHHSLPEVVDPENPDPVEWSLEFSIPLAMLESYVGRVRPLAGCTWKGNFYKCASDTTHPHWAAWAPVDQLNFHLPRCFGTWQFDA